MVLEFSTQLNALWQDEKMAAVESLVVAKEEALTFLAGEREKIMRMSHEQALQELLLVHKINNRINTIRAFSSNNLFDLV